MGLIVETGDGLANAESYASVATADAYHQSVGNRSWSGTPEAKEIALRKATKYLDTRFRFQGTRVLPQTQALMWPRYDVYIEGIMAVWPVVRVVEACCEAALRALTNGSLMVDVKDGSPIEVTVGPITTKYGSLRQGGQTKIAIVDSLLSPFLAGGGSASFLRLERV